MNANSKDSYDTIGFEDDQIITGATKITINENRDDAFKAVKAPEIVEEIKVDESATKEAPLAQNIMSKVKNFFNLAEKNENLNNSSNEVNITNSQDNSCKDRLLKKLQDNIEIEKSYQTFFVLLVIGLGLLCISLLFLPVIILSPYKFVLCFSIGSLVILTSFIFIYGTKSYFEILFSQNRFPFTLLFLGSIILGIVFAWSHYFFFSLICSIFQLVSLIVFILSFIPGGKNGISFIGRMITSPFANMWMRVTGQSYLPQ